MVTGKHFNLRLRWLVSELENGGSRCSLEFDSGKIQCEMSPLELPLNLCCHYVLDQCLEVSRDSLASQIAYMLESSASQR